MGFRRGVGRTVTAAVVAATVVVGGSVFAPVASAQECAGTISTSVATSELPGGEWSVSDGCLPQETYFEYSDGPIQAKAAVTTVTYDDGHSGRVAAGTLTLGGDIGLSIVGVEDAATGLVKWSAVLGAYSSVGDTVTVSGEGITLFPTDTATVTVSISGTGTDVGEVLEPTEPTPTAPESPGDQPAAGTGDGAGGDALPTPGAGEVTTTTVAPAPVDGDTAPVEDPGEATTTTVASDPTG